MLHHSSLQHDWLRLQTMENNAFSFYSNVFGIIAGSVSLITLAFAFHSHLPSNKIKSLEVLLDETDRVFKSAFEDGLLPQQEFRYGVEYRLSTLREYALVLRYRAYCATTWVQDCKEFFKGLSSDIGKTSFQLKLLRAEIITSSEKERRKLCAIRDATSPANSNCRDTFPVDHSNPTDVTSIATSQLTENTMTEISEYNGKAEVFTTAVDQSDAASDLSTQPMKSGSSSYWSLVWKNGSKSAIEGGTYDHFKVVKVHGISGRVIRPGGHCIVPVQTIPSEVLHLGDHGQQPTALAHLLHR